MEIWLDTCDKQLITAANRFGIIYGVTTNPSILAEADEDPESVIQAILDLQDGPVAVQVTPEESSEMIKRAHALRVFSDRIIVKVPVTQQGLMAIKELSNDGVPVMATALFQPNQALLAALAGAEYIAPYVGRMFDAGIDAYGALRSMVTIYQQYGFNTKILAAAIKTTDQITTCAEMGLKAITLKHALFSQLIADDQDTLDCIRAFNEVWESREHHSSLML